MPPRHPKAAPTPATVIERCERERRSGKIPVVVPSGERPAPLSRSGTGKSPAATKPAFLAPSIADDLAVVAEALRARRALSGLPQLDFARSVGVTAHAVSKFEALEPSTPYERLVDYAARLGLDFRFVARDAVARHLEAAERAAAPWAAALARKQRSEMEAARASGRLKKPGNGRADIPLLAGVLAELRDLARPYLARDLMEKTGASWSALVDEGTGLFSPLGTLGSLAKAASTLGSGIELVSADRDPVPDPVVLDGLLGNPATNAAKSERILDGLARTLSKAWGATGRPITDLADASGLSSNACEGVLRMAPTSRVAHAATVADILGLRFSANGSSVTGLAGVNPRSRLMPISVDSPATPPTDVPDGAHFTEPPESLASRTATEEPDAQGAPATTEQAALTGRASGEPTIVARRPLPEARPETNARERAGASDGCERGAALPTASAPSAVQPSAEPVADPVVSALQRAEAVLREGTELDASWVDREESALLLTLGEIQRAETELDADRERLLEMIAALEALARLYAPEEGSDAGQHNDAKRR